MEKVRNKGTLEEIDDRPMLQLGKMESKFKHASKYSSNHKHIKEFKGEKHALFLDKDFPNVKMPKTLPEKKHALQTANPQYAHAHTNNFL